MKVAITGGTAGIGQALGDLYEQQGHTVIRLSRRNGYNIRVTPKIVEAIKDCDMFINNAQVGFAQTEILAELCREWQGTGKTIVVISTIMTQHPVSVLPGIDMDLYRVQKVALEELVKQMRHLNLGIKIMVVRPGNIATSPDKTVPPAADVNVWAATLVELFSIAEKNNMVIPEISLGPAR